MICPSASAGGDALETWDEGNTVSPLWEEVVGFSNNGIVEPCELTVEPYYYYGWAMADSNFATTQDFDNLAAAIESLGEAIVDGDYGLSDSDWELLDDGGTPVPVNGAEVFYRMREGIERFFITDINNPAGSAEAQSSIVTMHDAVSEEASHYNHIPGGANVLYMDGHVSFIKWVAGAEETNPFPVNLGGFLLHEAGEGGGHDHSGH
ncbi:MAG: hypothetical protein HYV27_03785 [Candidatus Hydrogenedentes bacterium]|nr:hypothetical protein [Candidatus Hydrogenedentota bacterium]